MQRFMKAIAALMLTVTAMLVMGCTKPDEPNNGGNGGNNGGETPDSFIVTISANPTDGGSVTGGGTFHEGEICTVSATANTDYLFVNWTENDSVVSTEASYAFTVIGNRSFVANFTYNGGSGNNAPAGAINGKFTINANGDQVYFSQGNLQYIGSAATPYWKFADNQWDCLGTSTGQNSTNSDVDRDLFGWGTSGYHDTDDASNVNYQPWSTSVEHFGNSNYWGYGPSIYAASSDLIGSSAYYDWGVWNPISNGGNSAGLWRTLTGGSNGEWYYVFNTRSASTVNGVADARYTLAKVADVEGIILFPDSYTHPSGVAQPVVNTLLSDVNNYSAEDFALMQSAGAVFLPVAGYRIGTSYHSGAIGEYWSSSHRDTCDAYSVCITNYPAANRFIGRSTGAFVRLVCPAEN